MSEWFDHNQDENSTPNPTGETPQTDDAAPGQTPEAPQTPLSGAAQGYQDPATPAAEPVSPDTQNGNAYPPPAGGYYSQGGYDPYGWQQYRPPQSNQSPAPQPPKKKKSVAGILIGLLAVVCAGTIITLSVLLAVALNDDTPPVEGTSSTPVSQANPGTAPNRDPNENAPSLDIQEPDEDAQGLTANQIYEKAKDSTVVLTMYMEQNTFAGTAEETLAGEASGIVMSADGYIITNRHCVINEDAGDIPYSRIEVTLYDGRVFESAEIIGSDKYSDLAVIKVDATDLQEAEFGDSSLVAPGDRVVAIGNAGGLRWTITQGILSGSGRDVYTESDYAIKCLQVDAAINPGNSGGPLFNTLGQVIGINSAKGREEYENLGFAIPINEAKTVIDDLTMYGYAKGRVMLSITGFPFSRTDYDSGFQIYSINSDSVFVGTQVQVGDIITHVAGARVRNAAELTAELSKHKVGEEVEITLYRIDSRTRRETVFTVKVTLVESRGT